MKQIVVYTILLNSLFLASCADRSANAQSPAEPIFLVAAKNSDDEITLQFKDNTATVEIHSPSGIGFARFQLESGELPEKILVRLYLRGLEEFRLIAGQNSIVASISSSVGIQAQSQRKISGNSEQELQSNDTLWLDVQIISDSQSIPLENGYFEIILPEEFIQESGNSFEIQWIDFYR